MDDYVSTFFFKLVTIMVTAHTTWFHITNDTVVFILFDSFKKLFFTRLLFFVNIRCVFHGVRTEIFKLLRPILFSKRTVSGFRRIVAGPPQCCPRFAPRFSPCEISDGQSGTGQLYFPVTRFSPIIITPPLLHAHLLSNNTVIRLANGLGMGTFKEDI